MSGNDTTPTPCPVCGRTCSGVTGLWQHLKSKASRDRPHALAFQSRRTTIRGERRLARAEVEIKRDSGEPLTGFERSLLP
jgi:hypothetical protein